MVFKSKKRQTNLAEKRVSVHTQGETVGMRQEEDGAVPGNGETFLWVTSIP